MKPYKVAVIEARIFSSRLPGKVMMPLNGIPMLEHIINRVKNSKKLDHIILASTTAKEDDLLQFLGRNLGIEVYRGSRNNVIKRILGATIKYSNSILIQITGDNPFIESKIIDKAITVMERKNVDYVCNHLPREVPIGCEVRVYKRESLEKLSQINLPSYHKSNVTSIFYENIKSYKIMNIDTEKEFMGKNYRLTVDEVNDYILADTIYKKLYKGNYISLASVIKYLSLNKKISQINSSVTQKNITDG